MRGNQTGTNESDGAQTPIETSEPAFRNYYCCPYDGATWVGEWSCTCNDRCPRCGAEIEPHDSEDI